MSVAALITIAKGAGTVRVTSGGADFPILSMSESVKVSGPDGANGNAVLTRTISIDSMAVAGSEDASTVGTLKDSLVADLARRGDEVRIAEMGGTARILRAGGNVTGISGAGTTTRAGYPVVGIAFDAEKSVGAVVFFTLTIETVESTFAAAGGGAGAPYNLVHATRSRSWREDEGGNVSSTVRGEVTLKPGQDASAYVEAVILAPARTAAQGANKDFTSTRTENTLDVSVCGYEYTVQPAAFGGGGFTSTTVVDEEDVTRAGVEGMVTRTISGKVRGPSAYTTAQGRKITTPTNHVLVAERISQPNNLTGEVAYEYEYRTGKQGTLSGLTNTYFFAFRQSVSESGGGRQVMVAQFDDADPVIGFSTRLPAAYTETTDFEYTGADPSPTDIPRATNLSAADETSRRSLERSASAPGLKAARVVRTYITSTPYSTAPVPVEVP